MTQESHRHNLSQLFSGLQTALNALPLELVGTVEMHERELVLRSGELAISAEFPLNEGEVNPSLLHVHLTTRWHKSGSENPEHFPACLVAMRGGAENPYSQIVRKWITLVAPLVFSVVSGKSVLEAKFFSGNEPWSVSRREGYIGPMETFFFRNEIREKLQPYLENLLESELFLNASELAGDKRLHIAKLTLVFNGKGFERSLEIDEHAASLSQADWKCGLEIPKELQIPATESPQPQCLLSGFAVFYGKATEDSETKVEFVTENELIDESLETLLENFLGEDPPEFDIDVLRALGIDPTLVDDLNDFLPLAFGREFLDAMHVEYRDTYGMIYADGTFRKDLPLREKSVYCRLVQLAPGYCFSPRYHEAFKHITFASPEIQAVNNAMKHGSSLQHITLSAPIIVQGGIDPDVFEKTYKEMTQENPHETTP